MPKRFLCLYFDNWPIQRLVVEQPELKRQAIVLYTTLPGRGQRVSAVSPLAHRAGVRLEMPLSEARALLARRTPTARSPAPEPAATFFLPHDSAADDVQLQQLALVCEAYTPFVSCEVLPTAVASGGSARIRLDRGSAPHLLPARPECLGLEIHSVAHLCGGETGLAAALQREFLRRGYCVRAALADTFSAARAAARFLARRWTPADPPPEVESATVCLTASVGEIPAALHPLPLAALRLPPLTIDVLQQVGVERIEQLLVIPRGDLRSRFGTDVLLRIDQCSGRAEELLPWLHPPAAYQAQQLLDFPTTDRTTIEVILERLLDGLCQQLRCAGRGGLRWDFRMYSPDAPPLHFAIPLLQATALSRHVLPLVRIKLDQLGLGPPRIGSQRPRAQRQDFSTPGLCVQQVSVSVGQSIVLAERQRWLFDESPRTQPGELADLIDRLSTRLGSDQVVSPQLRAEGQAELAFAYAPLVGRPPSVPAVTVSPTRRASARRRSTAESPATPAPSQILSQTTSPAAASPLIRPLRLGPPQKIEVTCTPPRNGLAPVRSSREPLEIVWNARRWSVHRCWGAERIETGWWRGPTVRRDYWRVELSDGRWLWIYFDLVREQWFLHGTF